MIKQPFVFFITCTVCLISFSTIGFVGWLVWYAYAHMNGVTFSEHHFFAWGFSGIMIFSALGAIAIGYAASVVVNRLFKKTPKKKVTFI